LLNGDNKITYKVQLSNKNNTGSYATITNNATITGIEKTGLTIQICGIPGYNGNVETKFFKGNVIYR
jgi:hypothetical protein